MPTKHELEQQVEALRAELDEMKKQDSVSEAKLAALDIQRLEENNEELLKKNLAWEKRYGNVRDRAESFDRMAELFDKLRNKLG